MTGCAGFWMFLWSLQGKVTLLLRLLVVGQLLCLVVLVFEECLRCGLLVIVRSVRLVILVFAPPCLNCCYFFYLKSCLLFLRSVRLVVMVSLAVD